MLLEVLILLWILFLILAAPYAISRRPPETKAFAAYLVFVGVFSLVAAVTYAVLVGLIAAFALGTALENPVGIAVFLAIVFLPALAIARWQMRRPPRRLPTPAD